MKRPLTTVLLLLAACQSTPDPGLGSGGVPPCVRNEQGSPERARELSLNQPAVAATGARRVLDLGCGEGWLARALAAGGLDVTGVDGAPALVEAATAAGHDGPGVAPRSASR